MVYKQARSQRYSPIKIDVMVAHSRVATSRQAYRWDQVVVEVFVMPLDSNKIAHIQSVVLKSFVGRQKTVVFVYQIAGVYTYATVQAIFRPQTIIEPEIPDQSGSAPRQAFDLLMIVPISTNFNGVVFVADTVTASASAIAAAAKYAVIEALPVGIVPGGTHIAAKMRRFR